MSDAGDEAAQIAKHSVDRVGNNARRMTEMPMRMYFNHLVYGKRRNPAAEDMASFVEETIGGLGADKWREHERGMPPTERQRDAASLFEKVGIITPKAKEKVESGKLDAIEAERFLRTSYLARHAIEFMEGCGTCVIDGKSMDAAKLSKHLGLKDGMPGKKTSMERVEAVLDEMGIAPAEIDQILTLESERMADARGSGQTYTPLQNTLSFTQADSMLANYGYVPMRCADFSLEHTSPDGSRLKAMGVDTERCGVIAAGSTANKHDICFVADAQSSPWFERTLVELGIDMSKTRCDNPEDGYLFVADGVKFRGAIADTSRLDAVAAELVGFSDETGALVDAPSQMKVSSTPDPLSVDEGLHAGGDRGIGKDAAIAREIETHVAQSEDITSGKAGPAVAAKGPGKPKNVPKKK